MTNFFMSSCFVPLISRICFHCVLLGLRDRTPSHAYWVYLILAYLNFFSNFKTLRNLYITAHLFHVSQIALSSRIYIYIFFFFAFGINVKISGPAFKSSKYFIIFFSVSTHMTFVI